MIAILDLGTIRFRFAPKVARASCETNLFVLQSESHSHGGRVYKLPGVFQGDSVTHMGYTFNISQSEPCDQY